MGLSLLLGKDNDAIDFTIATLFVADFEHPGDFHVTGVGK
jgi:hypothetical protein